jgi:hypothetical protein
MTKPTGRYLIALASLFWLAACGPKAVNEPPPQVPAAVTPADAGLPAAPLARKGVIVPSDVKMQSAPLEAAPAGPPSGPSAGPGGN